MRGAKQIEMFEILRRREILHLRSVCPPGVCVGGMGGGGGYSDIFIHTLARAFFRARNFEFQYFWGFQKTEYLLGYEDLVDIFWGSSQNWTIKVQTGGYFLGCSNFNYLLGCLKCLIFFFFFFFFWGGGGGGVNGRWARAYI